MATNQVHVTTVDTTPSGTPASTGLPDITSVVAASGLAKNGGNRLSTAARKQSHIDKAYDTDGDGVLGPIEQCMKKYDTDGSGSFSAAEVKAIINDLEESKETARNLTKLLALFALGFIGLCGVMLGVVVTGNEASKENHVSEDSCLTDLDGNAVSVDAVESFSDLFDLPYMETSTLAKMNALTFYVSWDDTNTNRATFAPSGAYQMSTDVVALTTPEGFTITIDGTTDAEAATLTIGTQTYPIFISEARRRLRTRARRLAEGRREPPKLYSKHDWEAHKRSAHRELAERDQETAKPGARALKASGIDSSYSYDFSGWSGEGTVVDADDGEVVAADDDDDDDDDGDDTSTTVQVSLTLGMSGITCNRYGTGEEAVVNSALGDAIDGADASDFSAHVCTDSSQRRALLSGSVEISTSVAVSGDTYDDDDIASAVASTVNSAVSSGSFTTSVASYAAAASLSTFASVSVDSSSVTATATGDDAADDDGAASAVSNNNDYVPNTSPVGNITGSEDAFDGEVSYRAYSESK